jgi:D-threonate/D-erythronate kinase
MHSIHHSPLTIMIAVIADDFTGAAELAGISLRYGLTVELCLVEVNYVNADVLIVCTDSRSVNKVAAEKITASIVEQVLKLKPTFIYKKIDSVLRGHVLAELKIQMQKTGYEKAFIFPANPTLNRVIKEGKYFVYGINIAATDFANDPEFPVLHSSVKKMIGSNDVKVLQLNDVLPLRNIVIGEATSEKDTAAWVEKIDEGWMLVGAGDFYAAILHKKYKKIGLKKMEVQLPHMYVCGTAFEKRKIQIKQIDQKLHCVSYLSAEMIKNENANDVSWSKKTNEIIQLKNRVVIAIDESFKNALSLRTTMAKAVKEISESERIKEIFIEGGATAAAVLHELKIKKLIPVHEVERGVVRSKVVGLFITVKPGSYDLPKQIMNLYL